MALKMMLIALFATFVAVSASYLPTKEMAFNRLARPDLKENVMSEYFEYNEHLTEEEEEEPKYQRLLDEELELPNEMLGEHNAEVMENDNDLVQNANKLRDFIYQLYGCGNGAGTRPVTQGSTIALQKVDDKTYLSCSNPNRCNSQSCSDVSEGGIWTKCKSLVFRIYRKDGEGSIRVGDSVGLYYPLGGSWFSMEGAKGRTQNRNCPGKPNMAIGFQEESGWTRCYGEVFEIFARGKSVGDVINENDDIMLYYARWRAYVGVFVTSSVYNCGRFIHPPTDNEFDKCSEDQVFKILKQ